MVKIIYYIVRAFVCLHKHVVLRLSVCTNMWCCVCLFAQTCGAAFDPLWIMSGDRIEFISSVIKLMYFSQRFVINVHPRIGHEGPEGE
jgi:hypothetical protein